MQVLFVLLTRFNCAQSHTNHSVPHTGREALEALDTQGWQRSYHQRLFHDNFIRACARIFWKTEPPGSFARNHQKILEMNGWDHLSQEILVSTPRRCALRECNDRTH